MSKGKDLLKSFEYIDDEYLDLVEEMSVKNKKVWWKTSAAAAAVVGVLASASVVAYASNLFGIKDLVIASKQNDEVVTEAVSTEAISQDVETKTVITSEGETKTIKTADGNEVGVLVEETPGTEKDAVNENSTIDLISLSGFNTSPEAMATAEWMEFCDNYDKDGSIRDAHNYDELGAYGEDVKLYNVYSEEMANELREIVAKYNLDLHKEKGTIAFNDFEEYFGGKLVSSETECTSGYTYDDGTVQFEASLKDKDGYVIEYQFRRNTKGIFDEVYLNVGNAKGYAQEEYTTKDGSKVILACSDETALIIVDKEKSFSVVNIMADWYEKDNGAETIKGEFTMDKLEEFADTFDFSLLK